MFFHIPPRTSEICDATPAHAPMGRTASRTQPASAAATRVRPHPADGTGPVTWMLAKLSLALCILAFAPDQAAAEALSNCAPRDAVVDRLASKYGESRKSIGLGARGTLVETYASAQTGTWTITITTPNGNTCLVASGQSWEALAEIIPTAGQDT